MFHNQSTCLNRWTGKNRPIKGFHERKEVFVLEMTILAQQKLWLVDNYVSVGRENIYLEMHLYIWESVYVFRASLIF